MITPQTPYGCFDDRRWIEYSEKPWTGVWHPGTMELEQRTRGKEIRQFRRTCLAIPQHRRPEVAVVDTAPGVVPNVGVHWDKVLYMLQWSPKAGGVQYVGESGGENSDGTPPDPELPLQPVAGMQFDVFPSGVTYDPLTGAAVSDTIKSRLRVHSVGAPPWWADRFPDCVYNSLWERPDEPAGYVYGYLWARGVGLVNAWWGWKDQNNVVGTSPDGQLPLTWEITRWGQQ